MEETNTGNIIMVDSMLDILSRELSMGTNPGREKKLQLQQITNTINIHIIRPTTISFAVV